MKCPYCGTKGAKVNPDGLLEGAFIDSTISCKNPPCAAYKPLLYGAHPDMTFENKKLYEEQKRSIENGPDSE